MTAPSVPLAAIRQPAFLHGPDGRVVAANDRAEALAGRQLAGCSVAEILAIFRNRHPDGTAFTPATLPPVPATAGREAVDVPMTVTAADGATVHLLVTAAPLDGGGALVVWQDVTELQRTERDLRRAHGEMASLIESISDSFLAMDRDWRVTHINRRALEYANRDPAEVVGRTIWEAFPEIRGTPLEAFYRAAMESPEPLAFEHRSVVAHGRVFALRASHSDEGLAVYGRDVTEATLAAEALRESEERFRTAFEESPLGMGLGDPDGRVLDSNAVLEEMLGYGKDELRGLSFAAFTHPDDLARELPLLQGVLAGRGDRYEIEKRYVRRDGRTVWVRLVAALVRDDAGAPRNWIAVHEDVTVRRRMEAALVAANAEVEGQRRLLDTVLGALPYHVSVWGRDERLVWANEGFAASLGRPRDALPGLLWHELGGPDPAAVVPMVRGAMEAAFAGAPVSRELELPLAGGGTAWRELTVLPFGTDALLVITGDVSGRKRTEAALAEYAGRLRESEREARARAEEIEFLYDTAPVGLCVLDRELRYVRLNRRFAEIDGISVEAHLGRTPREVVPDIGDQAEAGLRRVLETGEPAELEVCGETPAEPGVVRYWDERWDPVRDDEGAITGVSISAVEVTERKRAEAALQESAAKYRSLFTDDITGDFIASVDGRILDCNPAFARMFGFASVEEALGSSMLGTYVDPREREVLLDRIRREGKVEYDERFRRRRDGERFHVVENILGRFDDGGALVRTQGYIIDDTQRHLAEQALRAYAEDLRRSNEDLERFAYVSSHDLQEPLRSIVSFSQLLERRYRGKLDADADDYIGFIVEGGVRMQTLIQDLLAYSRVNTTAQQHRPTGTEEVVASVERQLGPQLADAGAVLTHDPLPTVTADPVQLEQVFTNLVSNAIKFRRPDEPLRVHVGARRIDGFWEFSVRDNGIGIEPEYLDQIFVIFKRLHTKDAYPGTGIGLAIVKRIVDRHGGTVRVESTPGQGSTFFFTLPAA